MARRPARRCAGNGQRRRICLHEALPEGDRGAGGAPSCCLPAPQTCAVPRLREAADSMAAFRPSLAGREEIAAAGIPIKPVTAVALDMVRHRHAAPVRAVHVYTDGAYSDDGQAGYAVAVVATHVDGEFSFLGAAAGSWQDDRGLFEQNGPVTNNAVEIAAVCWALLVAYSLHPEAPLTVHPDSTVAMQAAQRGPATEKNQLLASVAAGLHQVLALQRTVAYCHIHGHTGHPWNELVDTLAGHAARHRAFPAPASLAHILKLRAPDGEVSAGPVPWLHVAAARGGRAGAYPAIAETGDDLVVTFAPPMPVPDAMLFPGGAAESRRRKRPARQSIRIMTVNVLTMSSGGAAKGLRVTKRMAGIQQQMKDDSIAIAAVQEARTPESRAFTTRHYHVVASAATPAGNYGCQLWFARDVGGHRFGPQHIAVVASDPRYLAVALRAPTLTCCVVCYHAPSSNDGVSASGWWDAFAGVLRRVSLPGTPLILMGDANGRLGSRTSAAVGDCEPEQEDDNGTELHKILVEYALWAPATFAACWAGGPAATWVPPGGGRGHRIDFIALPAAWRAADVTAANSCIDIMTARIDHVPTMAQAIFMPEPYVPLPRRRARICDVEAALTPENRGRVAQMLAAIPDVPWDVDVHAHVAIVNDCVRRVLMEVAPPVPRPQNPAITGDTWSLICARRPWRRTVLAAAARMDDLRCALAFAVWAGRTRAASALAERIAEQRFIDAAAAHRLAATAPALKQALRDDKAEHQRRLRDAIRHAAVNNDHRALHRSVRQLAGRFRKSGMPAVAMMDGTLARTPAQAAERWRQHAEAVHDGCVVAPAALLERAGDTQRQFAHVPRSIQYVPTICEVTAAFAASKPRKAFGEDCIPSDVVKAFAEPLGRLFHPIVTKSALRISEPLQWRGGMLAYFYKGKGDPHQCASSREVVLADATGKAVHRCRRAMMRPILEGAARDTQMGGIQRRATDFAGHMLRTAMSHNRRSGASTALIFVDVVAAFYNLSRPLVLPVPPDHEQAGGARPDLLTELQAHPHLASMAAAAAMGTWFTIQAAADVTQYRRGVLPGDPEADLLFALLAAKILNDIQRELRGAGLAPERPEPHECIFAEGLQPVADWPADVSYVDDTAFAIQAPAEELVHATGRALQIIHRIFGEHSLELSFEDGKTEVLLDICGAGSRAVKHRIAFEDDYVIGVELGGAMVDVRVCRAYKHLGTFVAAGSDHTPEVRHRAAEMAAGLAMIRAPLLYADADQSDKNAVLEPYLWSKLFLNSGTWGRLTAPQLRKLNGSYLRALSAAAAVRYVAGEPSIPLWRVHDITGQPPIGVWLTVRRMRYLQRVIACAPAPLRWLLDADRAWIQLVTEDLTLLHGAMRQLESLPPPAEGLRPWLLLIQAHPGPWREMLRLYVRREVAKAAEPPQDQGHAGPARRGADGEWSCYECGAAFDTRRAMACHARRAHGVRPPHVQAVHGTACLACLREFHTRVRLTAHLAVGSTACCDAVLDNVEPPEPGARAQADAEERARAAAYRAAPGRHHPCHKPMVRLSGPLPWWAPGREAAE